MPLLPQSYRSQVVSVRLDLDARHSIDLVIRCLQPGRGGIGENQGVSEG